MKRWYPMALPILGVLVVGAAVGFQGSKGNSSPLRARRMSVSRHSALMVYSAGPRGLAEALVKGFEHKTGIPVDLYESTTGKVLGRLEAEASDPHADVVMLADWSAAESLDKQRMLLAFRPVDVASVRWKAADDTYFGYSASALGITYNTKLVKHPPTTWAQATEPQWRNKVVIPDPAQSGSAVDFVGGYLQTHANGWSLFRKLAKNGAVLEGANAEALDQVITGAKDMVLAGVDYMAYSDIAKGEPLGIVYPHAGTVVNPRPVMILKSSKEVSEAEKFVNFTLSIEGQHDVTQAMLLPGLKTVQANPKRAPLSAILAWPVNWAVLAHNKASILEHVANLFS